MGRPTSRVLAVLDLLQSGGTHTASALATRLGIDERTVRRHIEHLLELEVPVEAVRGRFGGYRIAAGSRMPPLMLTDDEALAIVLGLVAGSRAGLTADLPDATESAAAKIRRVLPRPLGRRLDAVRETAEVTTPPAAVVPPAPPRTDVLLRLAEATREHHSMLVEYDDREGVRSERALDPYGLVAHVGRWYLAARDSRSGEVRTFRVDRISNPRLLTATFESPVDFEASVHVMSSLARAPWGHQVAIRIHATEADIRRVLPANIAVVSAIGRVDDWHRVELNVEHLDWMPAVLASLDRPFVIEGPDELRERMTAFAERLSGYASERTSAG